MSIMLERINAGEGEMTEQSVAPVMATPAAFVAGAVAGAKVSGALVAAAAGGAAVGAAVKK